MKVQFTDIVPDYEGSNWVYIYAIANGGLYYVSARVFTKGSDYGINGGRVSMLWVEKHRMPVHGTSYKQRIVPSIKVADYDRGEWNTLPLTPTAKAVVDAVVDLFDNHWEDTGLKSTPIGWVVEKPKEKIEIKNEVYRVHVKKTIEVAVDVEAPGAHSADAFVSTNVMVDLSASVSCSPGCGKIVRNYNVVEGSETTSIGSIEDVTDEYNEK